MIDENSLKKRRIIADACDDAWVLRVSAIGDGEALARLVLGGIEAESVGRLTCASAHVTV